MVAMHNHVALPMPCLISHPCYLRKLELHKPWGSCSPGFGSPNFSCFFLPLCFCTDYSLHQGNPWPTPVTSCKKTSWPFKTELGTFLKVFPRTPYLLLYSAFGVGVEGGGEEERHYQRSKSVHLNLLPNEEELVSNFLNPHLQILNQNNFITVGNIL